MARPTVAQLAARLDVVEAELAELRGLREREGLTPDEVRANFESRRRADLSLWHSWLWSDLGSPGKPVVVSIREATEVLAAHGRFPTSATVEQYLTQMAGIKLAVYLGARAEGGRSAHRWGINPPAPGRTSPRPGSR